MTSVAISLAERDGLAGVTMEGVAARLGCTKMALYRHVRTKADLVSVMFDTAMGPPPGLETDVGWRACLARWAHELLARYGRHPWALDVPHGPDPLTRNRALWLEAALQALTVSGLALSAQLDLVLLLNAHVVFSARLRRDVGSSSAEPDAGDIPTAAWEELQHVAAALAAGLLADGSAEPPGFVWGLECILSGAAANVSASGDASGTSSARLASRASRKPKARS